MSSSTKSFGPSSRTFDDGSSQRFDLLVGADGDRSVIRQHVLPDSRPQYAGYSGWRGNYPESRLRHRAAIHRGSEAGAWHSICLEGGHGVVYMIPNFDDGVAPGHRRVNWGIYGPQPPAWTSPNRPRSRPVK